MRDSRSRWVSGVALAGLGLVVAAVGWWLRAHCVDDAFIFARYARNLATRGEWAYNPGEPVFATTSVLWTILLAGLERARLPAFEGMVVLFALSMAALVALVFRALRSRGTAVAFSGALLVSVHPVLWGASGLETALALALVVGTADAMTRGSELAAGVLLGLAILARPDAVLLAALLVGREVWQTRRIPWRLIAASAAVYAPWAAYSVSTFGTILPATLGAKTLQTAVGWWATRPPFAVAALTSSPYWFAAALAIPLALWSTSERLGFDAAQLCIAYGVLQTIAYALLRVPSGYPWHYAPLAMGGALALVLALARLTTLLRRARPSLDERFAAVAFAAVVAVAVLQSASALRALVGPYRLSLEYREAAEWLRRQGAAGDAVAATEIGYLGYYSGLRVVDLHALIHPAFQGNIARGDWSWWRQLAPRFLVVHQPPWFAEPDLSPIAGRRAEGYVFRRAIPPTGFSGGLAIFERVARVHP